jgi:hypothetical protein
MLLEKGHYFIIRDLSGFQTIVRAAPKIYSFNKCAVDLNQVIGRPFDSCFEVLDRHTGHLKEIEDPRTHLTKAYLEEFAIEEDDVAEGKNNSEIGLVLDSAQSLT